MPNPPFSAAAGSTFYHRDENDTFIFNGRGWMSRESLGRLVRELWIEWAKEQPAPKPSWLVPWEGLSEPDREVDRRIGEGIAMHVLTMRAGPGALQVGPGTQTDPSVQTDPSAK